MTDSFRVLSFGNELISNSQKTTKVSSLSVLSLPKQRYNLLERTGQVFLEQMFVFTWCYQAQGRRPITARLTPRQGRRQSLTSHTTLPVYLTPLSRATRVLESLSDNTPRGLGEPSEQPSSVVVR